MTRLKIFIALFLVSPLVFAVGEKTFTWVPPTEYEDASPLPQGEIQGYRIYCDGALLADIPNEPLNTDTYDAPPGTFSTGTHTCHATTVTIEGVESSASNTINFTVAPGVPRPPVLSVTP